jgi:hypothetical protein
MRFLTGKRIIFGVTGLLIVLALAGWFLFGSNLFMHSQMAGAPPGSTIDAECAVVYRQVMQRGFKAIYFEAEDGFKVEKALYISGREAKTRYNAVTPIGDDSHICYVQISGNIEVWRHSGGLDSIYPTAYGFYDPDSLYSLEMRVDKILTPTGPAARSNRPAALQ